MDKSEISLNNIVHMYTLKNKVQVSGQVWRQAYPLSLKEKTNIKYNRIAFRNRDYDLQSIFYCHCRIKVSNVKYDDAAVALLTL
jgi:rRNA maturation protein Nop10